MTGRLGTSVVLAAVVCVTTPGCDASPDSSNSTPPASMSTSTGADTSGVPAMTNASNITTIAPLTTAPPTVARSAVAPPVPIRVPTSADRTGADAGFTQLLAIDGANGCTYGYDGILLVWPPGWAASQDPPGVLDERGALVAEVGDTVSGGGRYYPYGTPFRYDDEYADCEQAASITTGILVIGDVTNRDVTPR